MKWHPETLPGTTATKLEELAEFESIRNAYLAGGTAIALQLGHPEGVPGNPRREPERLCGHETGSSSGTRDKKGLH